MIVRPLPFVWPYAVPFWIVYVWAFLPERRFAKAAQSTPADSGSLKLILGGMQASILIAFVLAFFVRPLPYRTPLFWAGLVSLFSGSALRRHCFRVLGEYFTYAVRVVDGQEVIDRGAYRWVRHPSYTGGMLMFAGIGLALGNWASVALLLATSIAVYSYRVMVEERALVAAIGEPYRAYMARRKRFIPFVI